MPHDRNVRAVRFVILPLLRPGIPRTGVLVEEVAARIPSGVPVEVLLQNIDVSSSPVHLRRVKQVEITPSILRGDLNGENVLRNVFRVVERLSEGRRQGILTRLNHAVGRLRRSLVLSLHQIHTRQKGAGRICVGKDTVCGREAVAGRGQVTDHLVIDGLHIIASHIVLPCNAPCRL